MGSIQRTSNGTAVSIEGVYGTMIIACRKGEETTLVCYVHTHKPYYTKFCIPTTPYPPPRNLSLYHLPPSSPSTAPKICHFSRRPFVYSSCVSGRIKTFGETFYLILLPLSTTLINAKAKVIQTISTPLPYLKSNIKQ